MTEPLIKDPSRLRPFIADSEDGPDTALLIRGFSGRDEIQAFVDALLHIGVMRPPEQKN